VWKAAGLWHVIKENLEVVDGYVSLFFQLLEQLPHQQVLMFVMTLWSIWKKRNEKLWSDIDTNPRMSVHMARETLLEWQQVRERAIHREAGASNSNGETSHNYMTGGANRMRERSSAISMQQSSRNMVVVEYECVSEEGSASS